ncbi:MAG: hypothetical protein AAGJ35_16290, partial [Myxococcota bacterium]
MGMGFDCCADPSLGDGGCTFGVTSGLENLEVVAGCVVEAAVVAVEDTVAPALPLGLAAIEATACSIRISS